MPPNKRSLRNIYDTLVPAIEKISGGKLPTRCEVLGRVRHEARVNKGVKIESIHRYV